jgi:hypothetical protein
MICWSASSKCIFSLDDCRGAKCRRHILPGFTEGLHAGLVAQVISIRSNVYYTLKRVAEFTSEWFILTNGEAGDSIYQTDPGPQFAAAETRTGIVTG